MEKEENEIYNQKTDEQSSLFSRAERKRTQLIGMCSNNKEGLKKRKKIRSSYEPRKNANAETQ